MISCSPDAYMEQCLKDRSLCEATGLFDNTFLSSRLSSYSILFCLSFGSVLLKGSVKDRMNVGGRGCADIIRNIVQEHVGSIPV